MQRNISPSADTYCFRSHETFAAFGIALMIGSLGRLPMTKGTSKYVMSGMILSPACTSDVFPRSPSVLHPLVLVTRVDTSKSRLALSARLLYDTTAPFECWSAVSSFQRAAANQDLVQVERLLVLSCYCRGHRTIFYAIRAAYASYS